MRVEDNAGGADRQAGGGRIESDPTLHPERYRARFVPGTHLRKVSEIAVGRYQNIRGQQHMVCEAGTLIALEYLALCVLGSELSVV